MPSSEEELREIAQQLDRWKAPKSTGNYTKLTVIGRLRMMHNRDTRIVAEVRRSERLVRARLEEMEALIPHVLYGRGPQRATATEKLRKLFPE